MAKLASELKAGDKIGYNGKWRKITHAALSGRHGVTVYFANSEMFTFARDHEIAVR